MAPPPTVAAALREAAATLPGDTPRLDAELLLADVLGAARSALFAAPERPLAADEQARYAAHLAARRRGVPLAYLRGRAEFWSLEFEVGAGVLVPRADTEVLVETALALCAAGEEATLVDLGTGSGAVAAALAHERPRARVVAVERSATAAAIARRNFDRLGLGRIGLVRGDWLAALDGTRLDVVVANPPYVAEDERAGLGPELAHEPAEALFAGPAGLDALARIIGQAERSLRCGAWLVLEHGHAQAAAVAACFAEAGFVDVVLARDLADRPRVTRGRRP